MVEVRMRVFYRIGAVSLGDLPDSGYGKLTANRSGQPVVDFSMTRNGRIFPSRWIYVNRMAAAFALEPAAMLPEMLQ